jgi:hypothetical protein
MCIRDRGIALVSLETGVPVTFWHNYL